MSLGTLVSLNLTAMPTLAFPPKEVIDGGSSAVLEFLREMTIPEEEEVDPNGPEAKAHYATTSPIIAEVLQAIGLEDLADNFRHANISDELIGRMSIAELKALGFRTMTQAIDFKEKAYARMK